MTHPAPRTLREARGNVERWRSLDPPRRRPFRVDERRPGAADRPQKLGERVHRETAVPIAGASSAVARHCPPQARGDRLASIKTRKRFDLVIAGAGIGGILCLKCAKDAGINAVALEPASGVGGLWRDLLPGKTSSFAGTIGRWATFPLKGKTSRACCATSRPGSSDSSSFPGSARTPE